MTTGRPAAKPDSPSRIVRSLSLLVGLVVIASACARGDDPTVAADGFHPDGWRGAGEEPAGDLYDPVTAGELLPDGFRQVLARDDIFPVYEPIFVTAGDAGWPDGELVIGVDLEGEARAYPVSFLNRREIVVDLHRGIPTFVTW